MAYQKLIIVGNLGKDPEMRYMPDGTPVTTLNIATNRKWNSPDGSQNEETTWFRVTFWRKQAETAAQYLTKGRQVMIEGRLTPDKATGGPKIWTRQDGTPGASYEVTGDRLVLLGGRGGEAAGGGAPGAAEAPEAYGEEEIPF
jgi:single-strand DNA-binding protein